MQREVSNSHYWLPLTAVWYTYVHPTLWCLTCFTLLFVVSATLAGTIVLFVTALPAQGSALSAAMGSRLSGLAWLIAVLLTLAENVLWMIIVTQIILSFAMEPLFMEVFKLHALPWPSRTTCRQITINSIVFTLLELLVCGAGLVLHILPVIGSIMFAYVTGWMLAWAYVAPYLDCKGLRFWAQMDFIWQHRDQALVLGWVMMMLNMIPFINVIFVFTNVVAGALWAVKLERSGAVEAFLAGRQVAPGAGAGAGAGVAAAQSPNRTVPVVQPHQPQAAVVEIPMAIPVAQPSPVPVQPEYYPHPSAPERPVAPVPPPRTAIPVSAAQAVGRPVAAATPLTPAEQALFKQGR